MASLRRTNAGEHWSRQPGVAEALSQMRKYNHLPCATPPERHLRQVELMQSIKREHPGVHSLYSQEATLKSRCSTSNDARKPRGRECCACSFRNGRIGIGQPWPRTIFQANEPYFASLCLSVFRVSEEICSQQAVSLSCSVVNMSAAMAARTAKFAETSEATDSRSLIL